MKYQSFISHPKPWASWQGYCFIIFQNKDEGFRKGTAGFVPKGGVAFFLPKILGYSKAYEILLSGKDITGHEAISLDIVDQIAPLEKLEETALEVAQCFSQRPISSVSIIKRLLNYSRKDLEDYLRLENKEHLRIFLSSDFRNEIKETHIESELGLVLPTKIMVKDKSCSTESQPFFFVTRRIAV